MRAVSHNLSKPYMRKIKYWTILNIHAQLSKHNWNVDLIHYCSLRLPIQRCSKGLKGHPYQRHRIYNEIFLHHTKVGMTVFIYELHTTEEQIKVDLDWGVHENVDTGKDCKTIFCFFWGVKLINFIWVCTLFLFASCWYPIRWICWQHCLMKQQIVQWMLQNKWRKPILNWEIWLSDNLTALPMLMIVPWF